MRNFYSGRAWTPNPEITKKCSLKTGFAVHPKSDPLSSQFRNPCPVQNGIGVQYTPDFARWSFRARSRCFWPSRFGNDNQRNQNKQRNQKNKRKNKVIKKVFSWGKN